MGIDFVKVNSSGNNFAAIKQDFFDRAELPGFEGLGEDVYLFFGDVLVDFFLGDIGSFEEKRNDGLCGFLFNEWSYLASRAVVLKLDEAGLDLFEVEIGDEINF